MESFGTEPYKLVQSGGLDTSIEAAYRLDSATLERTVFKVIDSFGSKGCISDEVLAKLPSIRYSSVTARYKALLTKKYVFDTGERRKGLSGTKQRVLISYKFYLK